MSVTCRKIIDAIENLAPKKLAEKWDNVGLLIGSSNQVIARVLLTLDVNENVVDYAIGAGIDLIISHHPVIFGSFQAVNTDTNGGRIIAKLLKADIAVYAAHTNLDVATGGVNDVLARLLNMTDVRALQPVASDKLLKLVVFIPESHLEQVRQAIADAGAGHIGNYSNCSFQTKGTGTFLPLNGSTPYVGTAGKLECVSEYRLETIFPATIRKRVITAMLSSHPYEEVAYDLYPLENETEVMGLGRIGDLETTTTLSLFMTNLKQVLGCSGIRYSGSPEKQISKVAVCGGSGAFLAQMSALNGADVLVTADVKYHEAQQALEHGIAIVDAGHFSTEMPAVHMLKDYLDGISKNEQWSIEITVDTVNKDIFIYF